MHRQVTRKKKHHPSSFLKHLRSFTPRFEPLEDRRLLAAIPVGDELLINEYTNGAQQTVLQSQAVATLLDFDAVDEGAVDRGAVATFTGKGPGDSWGVFARFGDLVGLGDSGQFLVNQTTVGAQQHSAVAALPGGGFVIVWEGTGANYEYGIFARIFDIGGLPISHEFQVNTTSSGAQLFPSVASTRYIEDDVEIDRFVVTWVGNGVGDHWGVHARLFDIDLDAIGDGFPDAIGDEFLVNETTNGTQHQPHVAMAHDGEFVVTWAGKGRGDNWGVFARTFGRNGVPHSPEIRVNQMAHGSQIEPAVAITDHGFIDGLDSFDGLFFEEGAFVVTWTGYGEDDAFGTYASVFGGDGFRRFDDFLVNETTHGAQRWSSVAGLLEGGFVVSWTGKGEGDYWGTFVREFDVDGLPNVGERRVNTTQNGAQQFSSVAANLDGDYVVVWTGYGNPDPAGVYGRAYVDLDDNGTGDSLDDGPTAPLPVAEFAPLATLNVDGDEALKKADATLVVDEIGLAPSGRNPGILQDVNGDGAVSPTDAIAAINHLGRPLALSNGLFPDLNGDGTVSPTDVLGVVQELDRLNAIHVITATVSQQFAVPSNDALAVKSTVAALSSVDDLPGSGSPTLLGPVDSSPDAQRLPLRIESATDELRTDEWEPFAAVTLDDAVVEAVARAVTDA